MKSIIQLNDPFKPLELAGAGAGSHLVAPLLDQYIQIIATALKAEPDSPPAAVVNVFFLGWLNGVRGKMVTKQFLAETKNKAAHTFLEAAGLSIVRALRLLLAQGKINLYPVCVSQFPLTAYTVEKGAKRDIDQTAFLWEELFGEHPAAIWLPHGAYSAGIDLLLKEAGCRFLFLPQSAVPPGGPWMTPHGLPVVPYERKNEELTAEMDTLMAPSHQPLLLTFCYEEMAEKELLSVDKMRRCEAVLTIRDQWDEEEWRSIQEASGVLNVEWSYCLYATVHSFDEEAESAFSSLHYLLDGARRQFPDLDYAHQRMRLHYGMRMKELERGLPEQAEGAVLMLTWEFPPNIVGGMARHAAGLAEALVERGRDVIVLTASYEGAPAYEQINGIHVYRSGPIHKGEQDFLKQTSDLNLSLYQTGKEILQHHAVALIHTHDWLTGDAAILLSNEHQLPLVTTIHATEHGRNNGLHNDLQRAIAAQERKLIKRSDSVIVCSQPMKEEIRVHYSAADKDMTVIPNGVEFEQSLPAKAKFSHFKPFVFSIGRMVFEKGFQTFFDLNENYLKNTAIQFIIAGKGPLLETWREEVQKRGLQERIHFVGYVTDEERRALFEECEAAVFPSLYEPFGIVALEAMTFQKPVIAAATGGLKSFVLHKQTGIQFEAGNATSLSAALTTVLSQPGYAKELGRNGYEVAKELYSWTNISAQTEKVYDRTVFITKMEGART